MFRLLRGFVVRYRCDGHSTTRVGLLLSLDGLADPARQPGEPHHRPQLEHILFPLHALVLLTELLGQGLATVYILGADEVDRNLHAICQVAHLTCVAELGFRWR